MIYLAYVHDPGRSFLHSIPQNAGQQHGQALGSLSGGRVTMTTVAAMQLRSAITIAIRCVYVANPTNRYEGL